MRCALDNDVADQHVVAFEYEGGVTATMSIVALTALGHRKTCIVGTRVAIEGTGTTIMVQYFITVESEKIQVGEAGPGHGARVHEGANIQLSTDAVSPCQQWRLEYSRDGYYGIHNRHSNKVVDVAFCGYSDGTDIGQWGWLDNDCQKFRFVPTTDGWMKI